MRPCPDASTASCRAVTELYARGASAPVDCRGAETATCAARSRSRRRRAASSGRRWTTSAWSGDDIEPFLFATALALPGWTGMFARLERHPEEHPGGPPSSLAEFLAVRLLLERARRVARVPPRGRRRPMDVDCERLGPARARALPGARRRRCCGASPRRRAWSPDRRRRPR